MPTGKKSPSLPTQIEAENRSIQKVFLHHPLNYSSSTTSRNGRISKTQDAIKLGIDKISPRLSLTQAKFLVSDGNVLDLEEDRKNHLK